MEKGVYKDLYWQKLRQMHQFTFTYPKLSKEMKKNFLDIINGYKTLISICGSIEQRENLKEKIISQIKTICDKEKRYKELDAYKAEQSESTLIEKIKNVKGKIYNKYPIVYRIFIVYYNISRAV